MDFPPGPYGMMVSFDTWQQFIRASNGPAQMKKRIINFIYKNVYDEGFLDSFKLGYALGAFSNDLADHEHIEFFHTIVLTRNLDNVPIVHVRSS